VATATALAARLALIPRLATSSPPEPLLLAVRAARRALSTNPEDAEAFLALGEAYLRLAGQTREPSWQAALPALAPIRRAQALTALEQAALLRPDFDRPHALLAQLYFEERQLDRALDQLRARLRIAEQAGAVRGPDAGLADEQRTRLRRDVEMLEALVRRAEETYAANSEDKSEPSKVLDRALLAARHGLTRKALEMLLASHPAIFGQAGTQMQLELMLKAGRAYEVRETLSGTPHYPALQVQAAAACGDYTAADRALDQMSEPFRQVRVSQEKVLPLREAAALRVGGAVLGRPAPGAGPAGLAGAGYQQFEWLQPLTGSAGPGLLRQEADVGVLRGLLALESGDMGAARDHFAAALAVWGSEAQAATGAGLEFAARPIAQHEMGLLD
jgi:hypothetical protein